MKKLLAIILVLCSIVAFASAETDLASMPFDELYALRHKVDAEIMSRPEWKEVTVPAGQWTVGEDIPAGTYSISPSGRGAYVRFIDAKGGLIDSHIIRSESNAIAKITLPVGYVVEVDDGVVIFAPPKGLGF